MRLTCKLIVQYIRKSKRKSCLLVLSVMFAVVMITMVNTLQYSADRSEMEYSRAAYGDYHYIYNVNKEQLDALYSNREENHIVNLGITKHIKTIKQPYVMQMLVPDENFLTMTGATIVKGKLPEAENEIALEEWTLHNIGHGIQIGDTILLENENYILTGILKDREMTKTSGLKQVFLSSAFKEDSERYSIYVKFDESTDIKEACYVLAEKYGIIKSREEKKISENAPLLEALGVNKVTDKLNFSKETTLRGVLGDTRFSSDIVIIAISAFGAFIIYSIFRLSIVSRMSDYGIMIALGAKWIRVYFMVVVELLMLFFIGLSMGYVSGMGIISLCYHKISRALLEPGVQPGPICFPIESFLKTFVVLTCFIFLIACLLIRKIAARSIVDTMKVKLYADGKSHKKAKANQIKSKDLVNGVLYKYMFSKKSILVSILISLSLGGCIWLSTSYAMNQIEKNNDLTLKADDGLNSDYQISVDDARVVQSFTDEQIKEMSSIEGIAGVHPVRFFFGGMILPEEKLLMKSYFDSLGDIPFVESVLGGVWTKEDESNNYLLKSGIYGYDHTMLQTMKNYIIEGSIDIDDLISNNKIVVRLPMDGVGNYNSLDLHPGNKVRVKVQKTLEFGDESLKLSTEKEDVYEYKEFIIAATVKQTLVTNDYFVGDYGADIIMSNSQMDENFHVKEYQLVSASKEKEADSNYARTELQKVVQEVNKASLRDYTVEIERRNHYLMQGKIFLYGIAAIIFMVSLFNIFNNVSYLMLSRRNDFAVLRAMGITDKRFWGLLLKEGFLYGFLSSIIMIGVSLFSQIAIKYILSHVYLYIDVTMGISGIQYIVLILLNILIGMAAVVFPARSMLSNSINGELTSMD